MNATNVTERFNSVESSLAEIATINQQAVQGITAQSYKNKKYYNEAYRPQFHFTPETGFMNDPNGLVYHAGEYHLFYQWEPNRITSGNANWGHAVSKDLIHWEHLPIAIAVDDEYVIWSGSGVIDTNNTAGFGANAMILHYTMFKKADWKQSIGIAYSLDNGRTFTKYAGNPVIPSSQDPNGTGDAFRDPKVIWDVDRNQWLMVIAADKKISLFTSPNLKTWTYKSSFTTTIDQNAVFECSNLFKMKLDGVTDKWVMISSWGGTVRYWVGNFDGTAFIPDDPTKAPLLDNGFDFYATTTWNNAPDNNIYAITWANSWDYCNTTIDSITDDKSTNGYTGIQTLPRKLTLKTVNNESKIIQTPIDLSLVSLMTFPYSNPNLDTTVKITEGNSLHIKVIFDLTNATATSFGININKKSPEFTKILYDKNTQILSVDRTYAGVQPFYTNKFISSCVLSPINNKIVLDIYFDRSLLEVFGNDGITSLTNLIYGPIGNVDVEVFSNNGTIGVESLTKDIVSSVWNETNVRTNMENIKGLSEIWKVTSNGVHIVNVGGSDTFALSDTSKSGNYIYEVDFTLLDAAAVALVMKADRSLNTKYMVTIDATNKIIKYWGTKNGVYFEYPVVIVDFVKSTTYHLKVEVINDVLNIYIDGSLKTTITDVGLTNAIGLFGLNVWGSGAAYFQNIYVY
jgi:fructan beta-fructosidase